MNRKAVLVCLMMVVISLAFEIRAQDADAPLLADPQLDQLTGPIALYPDPLIAQILPAATQPSQIAIAAGYVAQGGDPNAIDSQSWDESVKAVAHYPDVINMMNANIAWTTQLGDAFVNQPSDVMNSVQRLRLQAQQLGNLDSSPQEEVSVDDGDIEILPTDPNLLYVPIYDPAFVFYQRPYGRHFISFGAGFGIGLWLNHDFDWHGHDLVIWGHDHPRPANWWHERPAQRREVIARAPQWHPAPGRVDHRPVIVNRWDRAYARPQPAPARVEPRREEPGRVVAPAPHVDVKSPVEAHTIPARPTVNANINVHVTAPAAGVFGGGHSAAQTRVESSRGAVSRSVPTGGGAAPRPSGGGGGGGGRPAGGGGNQKR